MINNRATMIANVTSYREGDEGFWTIASADGRRQLARLARLPDVPPPYALSGQQTLGLTRAKNPAENRSIREMFAFLERGGGSLSPDRGDAEKGA